LVLVEVKSTYAPMLIQMNLFVVRIQTAPEVQLTKSVHTTIWLYSQRRVELLQQQAHQLFVGLEPMGRVGTIRQFLEQLESE
jgi:hypothetical protein